MATFAEIDENNIVINIIKVPDSEEHRGLEYITQDLNIPGIWKQTSVNTSAGIHYDINKIADGGIAIRMNYAIIGGYYDPIGDAFHSHQPIGLPSFILNKENYTWEVPIPYPDLPAGYSSDVYAYVWDEPNVRYILIEKANTLTTHI